MRKSVLGQEIVVAFAIKIIGPECTRESSFHLDSKLPVHATITKMHRAISN